MTDPNDSLRRKIIEAYDRLDDDDISTERLLHMVAVECGCDEGDVACALRDDQQGGTGHD